jgi:hypothetical protein
MNMIPINEVVESWLKARKEEAHDDLDDWWREAMAHLRPPPEDDAPLGDGDA